MTQKVQPAVNNQKRRKDQRDNGQSEHAFSQPLRDSHQAQSREKADAQRQNGRETADQQAVFEQEPVQ